MLHDYLRGRGGRNMQHQEFWNGMTMAGLAGHWPDEGVCYLGTTELMVVEINGFRCRVLPKQGGRHRAQIQCHGCGKWIYQGRLHQHVNTDACSNQAG